MPRRRDSKTSIEKTVDSVIVHDMKNLAFRLSALLQNMDENYENPLFKKSMTDILGDTIRKMNAIVKRFKEQQQHVVVKLRVDVNQILSEVRNTFPSKSMQGVEVQDSLAEVPLIWGDSYYLHNAFHSIIENAMDAMPNGGILGIKTRAAGRGKNRTVLVEISDTGVGMNQSFLENKLFSPFVTTKEQGLGLGLFTSQQIVALHHGRIEVESAPGAGTTFRIILPANGDAA